MYLAIILGKSKLQIILVGIIFMICKLLDYKCIIENKYEDLKESFSIKGYTFNYILLFIVIYCGVNCLVNQLWDVGILIIGALCLIIYLMHKKLKLKVKDKYEIDKLSDKEIGRRDQLFEKRKNPKYAEKLFACGDEAGRWMFNTDNFEVLNNAIDTDLYIYNEEKASKVKKEFGIENKFVIGHVGRFSTQKNHEFLIDVFNEVQKLKQDSVLVLVGDGN